ncbi:MAG: enoyl-CoA hydratase/isomerase family protein [Planctomycetes bacterium]|nr:enoyl-CoA hydratase/isomerase family protein [Planctomycetota bacterium]
MPTVLEERRGSTLVLTLNRPERLNAVSEEVYGELLAAVARAEAEPEVRALVLTGAGRAFCVGADLKAHGEDARAEAARRHYVELGQDAAKTLLGSRLPVIAAINGHAIGAGLELALACDLAVVAGDAKLRFPEIGLGTFVGGGVTHTLPARVGLAAARELLLLCEFFSGERAVELGVFREARAADEVLPRALELAAEVGAKAPQSVAHLKRLLVPTVRSFDETLAAEAEALLHCMTTADWREGVAAFAERRPPRFTGD